MIFLLGKSGSGKSTLLNVSGGLDNPTCGEIIIKGKSSKDFTQSDFDDFNDLKREVNSHKWLIKIIIALVVIAVGAGAIILLHILGIF